MSFGGCCRRSRAGVHSVFGRFVRGFVLRKFRLWSPLLLVFLVVLGLSDPVEAAPPQFGPGNSEFPLPSLTAVKGLFRSKVWGLLPEQQGGTPDGASVPVPGSKTRAGRGVGRKPGKGAGELPTYRRFAPAVAPGLSGRAAGGSFDARTSVMD